MMNENEWRVIGPPGCGKTTWLSKQVKRAVEAGRRPLLTSLTKAAALEIGSRIEFDFDFSEEQVGTLHSHCFRALDRPALIESKEQIDEWNKYAGDSRFHLSLKPFGTAPAAEVGGRQATIINGDRLYESTLIYRAMMKPEELWPTEALAFHRKFRDWKSRESLHDFTDLIERSIAEIDVAPFAPDVIFVDEAQDHDRLELTLVRRWAESAEQIIIGGDPDQNLYAFRGAEPDAFYATEIPADNRIILKQSYRVPKAVHAEAVKMIRRVEDRVDVEYLPTSDAGEVIHERGLNLRFAHRIVKKAAAIADAGESVMILASCRFLLAGVITSLREAGLPFFNPYAPNNGAFNPLGGRAGTTSPQRLAAFLRPHDFAYGDKARMWSWGDVAAWIDPIDVSGLLKRGAKSKLQEQASQHPELTISVEELQPYLHAETGVAELESLEADPIGWFRGRLNKSRAKTFDYPIQVVRNRGIDAVTARPKIIVGTIHSVKGGEADHVFLFPDLSQQGYTELLKNSSAVIRAFYVGMTRAKKSLHLFDKSRRTAISWRD
jgi:superfamily I DNA/RNA helicase